MKVYLNRILMISATVVALALANNALAQEPLPDVPDCEDVEGGVTFNCPAEGPPTVVTTINLDEPTGELDLCTCNATLEECDPNLTSEDGSESLSCLSGGPLQAVPSSLDFINDGTTVCRTIGGERRCFTLRRRR